MFPTYRPIGQNAESERGNKQYFNLGLIFKENASQEPLYQKNFNSPKKDRYTKEI
jgi:hypothetical protein